MITLTLKPLHLAMAGALIGGILVAVVFLLLGSGSDGSSNAAVVPPTEAPSSPSPTTAPSSTPEPTAEPTQPPAPTSVPTAAPTSPPAIRSCAEIEAAGTYNSEEERQFFLDNCTSTSTGPAPTSPAPAPTSGNTAAATAQEELYRDRAQGSLNIFVVKLNQYFNGQVLGGLSDILELGAVMRRQAQDMERLPEPPPRFKAVHDQLHGTLISLANFIQTIVDVDFGDSSEFDEWFDQYLLELDLLIAAIQDYGLVVGIDTSALVEP